jgi:hypothetical protein
MQCGVSSWTPTRRVKYFLRRAHPHLGQGWCRTECARLALAPELGEPKVRRAYSAASGFYCITTLRLSIQSAYGWPPLGALARKPLLWQGSDSESGGLAYKAGLEFHRLSIISSGASSQTPFSILFSCPHRNFSSFLSHMNPNQSHKRKYYSRQWPSNGFLV